MLFCGTVQFFVDNEWEDIAKLNCVYYYCSKVKWCFARNQLYLEKVVYLVHHICREYYSVSIVGNGTAHRMYLSYSVVMCNGHLATVSWLVDSFCRIRMLHYTIKCIDCGVVVHPSYECGPAIPWPPQATRNGCVPMNGRSTVSCLSCSKWTFVSECALQQKQLRLHIQRVSTIEHGPNTEFLTVSYCRRNNLRLNGKQETE